MSLLFSLYLDIVRFAAALFVLLDHLCSKPFTNDVLWPRLGGFGQEAVIIFFVLSGYVIAYVTSSRETTLRTYATARVARLYSVVLIALGLTLLFDNIGMILNPEFYGIKKILWKPQSFEGYISSLFFVNEYQIFNFNGISPGSNAPYWSLSFEATYYVVAGLFMFTKRMIWIPLSCLIFFLAGKTIFILFPLWLIGYAVYFLNHKLMHITICYLLFFISIICLALDPYIALILPSDNFGYNFTYGRAPFDRNIVNDYFIAIMFAINIISGRVVLNHNIHIKEYYIKIIRWLGSLTFPLYLIHFPSLAFFTAISPWSTDSYPHVAYLFATCFLVTILATPLTEILKFKIKKLI